MGIDKRALFPNTFCVLNRLHALKSEAQLMSKNVHPPKKISKNWIRGVGIIDRRLHLRIFETAMYVATAAAAVFDLFYAPYRLYYYPKLVAKSDQDDIARFAKAGVNSAQQLFPASGDGDVQTAPDIQTWLDTHDPYKSAGNHGNNDILLSEEAKKMEAQIKNYITKNGLKFDESQENEYIHKAIACYARSSYYFGRVALLWVDFLLKKADREGKQIVFMARDGIAPYKLAQTLLKTYPQRYPNFNSTEKHCFLAYLTRKIVGTGFDSKTGQLISEGKKLIQNYLHQLGVKEGTPCIFVDVGFEGSMTEKIKAIMERGDIEFEFLISIRDDRAHGFLATQEERLVSVPHPTCNLAVHWLEDNHQGVGESPTHLIIADNGRIVPNTNPGKEGNGLTLGGMPLEKTLCVDPQRNPGEYLLRKCGQRAIKHVGLKYKIEGVPEIQAKKDLDEMLGKIRRAEVPLFIGRKA